MARTKTKPRLVQAIQIEEVPDSLFSEETERAVLGCFLLEPGCLDNILLRDEHFYQGRHRDIFRTMSDLRSEGVPIDVRTVQSQMELEGTFEAAGGVSYLTALDLDLPDYGQIQHYADILEERLLRRRMIQFANKVQRIAKDGGKPASSAMLDVQEWFMELRDSLVEESGLRSLGSFGEEVVEEIEQAEKGHVRGLSTGIKPLDDIIGGMLGGQLIVLAARPGRGKTTLATNIAQHVSMVSKLEVAMFSFEMSGKEIATRVVSSEASVAKEKMVRGYASKDEKIWLRQRFEERVRHAKFSIDDGENVRLEKICTVARRLKAAGKLDFLVVDQAQLVETDIENRVQEVSMVARTLKALARELDIPILLVSHMSRKIEERGENAEPLLSDLAESGYLERMAHIVIFIHYPDFNRTKYDEIVKALLVIAKDRDGREGVVPMIFNRTISTFMAESGKEER